MFWFLFLSIFSQSNHEIDLVIKGSCTFKKQGKQILLIDDKLQIPLHFKKVIIKNSDDKKISEKRTDKMGIINPEAGGKLTFIYKGEKFYNSCRKEFVLPQKQKNNYFYYGLLLSLGIVFLLWLNRKRFIHLFDLKNKDRKKMHTRGNIAFRKKTFSDSWFSGRGKVRIKAVTLLDAKPLAGVKIKTGKNNISREFITDAKGEIILSSIFPFVEISKQNYVTEKVKIDPEMGYVVVKMMNYRQRALFLLKKILSHYGIKNPSVYTPREALQKKVPHPQILILIEKIAYHKELQKSDLDKIEKVIASEKIPTEE